MYGATSLSRPFKTTARDCRVRRVGVVWRMSVLLLAVWCVFAGTIVDAVAQQSSYAQELERLRQDIRDLQRYVYSESHSSGSQKAKGASNGPPLSADAATRLYFKLQSLQEEARTLTGRLEKIENGQRRNDERLNRLISDVDLRLRTLESATGISPATHPNATSGSSLMNKPNSTAELGGASGEVPATVILSGAETGAKADGGLAPGQKLLGTVSKRDVAKVKPGVAPQATGKSRSTVLLRRPPLPRTAPSSGNVASARQTAVQPSGNVMLLPKGTPKEQYTYAFGLLKKRDFPNAARSLKAFVDKNPKHELAGNAMYWLGETRYDQKKYAEAARLFLDGYRRYPKSNKAPDNLLKLGKSLNSVGEKKSACAAWQKLLKDYPKASSRLIRNAKHSISQNKCS
jgi:tol-pal system protein YbgF